MQHHQRLQWRHDFVPDGVPHVPLLLGAQLFALGVVLHALQQVGQATGQNAQLVRAAQVRDIQVTQAGAGVAGLHVV